MKKVILSSFVLFIAISFTACKSEKKQEVKKVVVEKKAPFSLKEAANNIEFTAYKTTAKVGVKGNFKKVNILAGGEGNSIKEAIHNTSFSVPVSSLFTKDTSRDYKNVYDDAKALEKYGLLEFVREGKNKRPIARVTGIEVIFRR